MIEIVNNFQRKKIGVIGDLMLDQFIWGDAERISPEAPIPVVLATKETFIPGGAGNTANNIASLGGKAFMVGLIGQDQAAQQLLQELRAKGINTNGIIKTPKRITIQKIRIVARGQQIVRVDKERNSPLDEQARKRIISFIVSHVKNWDALVVSDYAKGLVDRDLAQKIIVLAKKHQKPILGDTKPKNASYFKNVTLLIPNYKEAIEISGIEDLKKVGRKIQKELSCDLIITQGAQGMTLFEKRKIKDFPAKAREIFDVSGAGDTVVAILALSLVSGANLEEATCIANYAAGIVVGKLGTATVFPDELKRELKNEK